MAITSKAMDKDLKDHRIETLEDQVIFLQKIKQDLQNKLLNSEKVIISKNSHLKVCDRLLDNYRNSDFKLKVELKYKDSEIDKLQNRIESLKDTIFKSAVVTFLTLGYIVYTIIKQSI